MAEEERQDTGEAVLDAIPLVVVVEDDASAPAAPARRGFAIPKIVDYLVVAVFMYFVL